MILLKFKTPEQIILEREPLEKDNSEKEHSESYDSGKELPENDNSDKQTFEKLKTAEKGAFGKGQFWK